MRATSLLALTGALLVSMSTWADEARINVNDIGRQRSAVAILEQGGPARVIWENSRLGILSRVVPLDAPDSASTVETLLAEDTALPSIPGEGVVITHRQPMALSDGDGGFWLIWIRERAYVRAAPFWEQREVLSQEIRRRHFNRDARSIDAERVVARATAEKPQVTAVGSPDGGFVVGWSNNDGDPTSSARDGVFARWFSPDGSPLSAAVRVSSIEDAEYATAPSLTFDARGRLLILWQAPDGSSTGIFGRIFDESHAPVDEPQRLNLNLAGSQQKPAAVSLEQGGFFALWQGWSGVGSNTKIYLQRLDDDGRPVGAERAISSGKFVKEFGPAIAPTAHGTWFAAWVDWDSMFPREIRGVELSADGEPAGEERQLNSFNLNIQYRATLFGNAGTGLFAIWEGIPQRRPGICGLRLDFLD